MSCISTKMFKYLGCEVIVDSIMVKINVRDSFLTVTNVSKNTFSSAVLTMKVFSKHA